MPLSAALDPIAAQGAPRARGLALADAGLLLRSLLVYIGLHLLYGQLPDRWLAEMAYAYAFTHPAAALIALVLAGEPACAVAYQIRSPQLVLAIVRGCEGIGALFLLTAALAASQGRMRECPLGFACGRAIVSAFNPLRLVVLYVLGTRAPTCFDLAHEFLFPGRLVMAVVVYCLLWSSLTIRRSAERAPAAAHQP
jgi:exosortase/archaeosortase family protein